jgi:hypothetical protein
MVSVVLLAVLIVVNSVFVPLYYVFSFKWRQGVKQLDDWFAKLALSVDQFGNVFCASLFNTILIKKNGIKYGDEDDTISYITALNRNKGTLKTCGVFLAGILEAIDKGHLDKSIYNKQQKDLEAVQRLER